MLGATQFREGGSIEAGQYRVGEKGGTSVNGGRDRRAVYGQLITDLDGVEDAALISEADVDRAVGEGEGDERPGLYPTPESNSNDNINSPADSPTTFGSKEPSNAETLTDILSPFKETHTTPFSFPLPSGTSSGQKSHDSYDYLSFYHDDSLAAAEGGSGGEYSVPILQVQAPTTEGGSRRSPSLGELYEPDSMVLLHRDNEDSDDDGEEWETEERDDETDTSPLVLNRPPPFPLSTSPSPFFSA